MANQFTEDDQPSRILVIDDNPSVHEAFVEILRPEPANEDLEQDEALMFGSADPSRVSKPVYEIEHALSGAEGIEKLRQAVAAGNPYHLAFVDIRMPGMDGVETIEGLWKLDPQLQTVICTAYADYRWEDLAKRLGRTDRLLVLKKPFHDIEVMQLASALLRKWSLGRQAAMKMEQAEALVARRTQSLLEYHRREHQRIRELDQTKLRHLSQLAQEFRAPLTEMLQKLEAPPAGKKPDPAARDTLLRNVSTLLALVDDSLQMRRLDPGDRNIDWHQVEIVAFMRGLMRMFGAGGRERSIEIHFQTAESHRMIWTDPVKLEKAIFNVLARALAAAGEGSRISVLLQAEGDEVKLQVEVPRPAAESPDLRLNDVGWLLSGEILRQLGGDLAAQSADETTPGGGGVFRMLVKLPGTKPEAVHLEAEKAGLPAPASGLPGDREMPVILVIEENRDFRDFIRQGLGAGFSILEADNAGQGLAVARENIPDLMVVAGDVSRPAGLKLCTDLKHDEMTSHIPVILLATEDSEASHVQALEAGVDEYLLKPFRMPLLKARVENLLENRRKLHEHFEHLQIVQPRELATNRTDAEFLRKVVELIEKNLTDYEFDVEKLARHMAVSRRQLFRKFKALAGCTPNVFIRDIRLKRAAQLLRDSQLTVSEIIYAVGFSDPKYFRSIFRERFGVLPGEYNKPLKPDA